MKHFAGTLLLLLMLVCQAFGQISLIPPAFYAVQGAPFAATIESVWTGGEGGHAGESVSRIVRDSEGRERFETPSLEEAAATGVKSNVVIYDLVREQVIKLDASKRTATVTPMSHVGRSVTIDVAARRGSPCRPAPGWHPLGTQLVAGLEACGQVLQGRELWLSTEYLMPLMSTRNDPLRGVVTERVMELTPGQPDAALFRIPAGYKVVAVSLQ